MKILIIDRDTMFSSLLASKLKEAGHEVFQSPIKNDGIEQIHENQIDMVFLDPAPLQDPKSILYQIRRAVHSFTYLVLMGEAVEPKAAYQAGCHEALAKPLNPAALYRILENAQRLCGIVHRLEDNTVDFPSYGGVIAKSAFNQLFLSSMDRVARHGENAQVIFIRLENYQDLKTYDGRFVADYAVSAMAQTLSRMRRQSDILGQTDVNEYALLLLRPQMSHEAIEAARRFASIMEEAQDILQQGVTRADVSIRLVSLPSGDMTFEHMALVRP